MKIAQASVTIQRRKGISLVELMIATGLTGFLATLLVTAWAAFGRPAVDVISRSRLAREASLAVASLSEDFGGSLATPEGRAGTKEQGKLVGGMAPAGVELWLCFDGGETPNGVADWDEPDTVVTYRINSGNLIREDRSTNVSNVAARDVDSLSVTNLSDRMRVVIGFRHRDVGRSFTIEALQP